MRYISLCIALGMTAISPAQAEVTNTASNGFTIQHQAMVDGSAEDVWKTIIAPSRYWNPDHSWSGNSDNFYLVPQAGGCFCELIRKTGADNIKSSEGSVQHMRVIYAHKNKVLRLSGALGPLQSEALTGTLTMVMQPQDGKTAVRFSYKVGGYMEFKVDEMAPAVDGVIGEQLARLAALFESKDGKEASSDVPEEEVSESEDGDDN